MLNCWSYLVNSKHLTFTVLLFKLKVQLYVIQARQLFDFIHWNT